MMQASRPFAEHGARPWEGSVRWVFLAIALVVVLAGWGLGLDFRELVPGEGGWRLVREFFAAALVPALDYEAASVPEGARPFWLKLAGAALETLRIAAAGMALSLLLGIPLGFAASRHFCGPRNRRCLRRRMVRVLVAMMRSVHELIWALVFLAAVGLSEMVAVVAIAIPYAGTLAKIFAEMLDESPDRPADALEAIGASRRQVVVLARLPGVIGEVVAYAFYRFECAVRSSAVLGFLGIPTIGYHLRLSFEESHFREVWSYLIVLVVLVVLLDQWSHALRRRLV